MSRPTKTTDAHDRLGVYKRLGDVPDRYRLYQHADAYAGRDVWTEFCEQHEYELGESETFYNRVDLAGDRWRAFMDGRRHHALATPADVEEWSQRLLADYVHDTAYRYWIRVEHFYRWLQWHTEHPHVYHPVLMAAVEYDAAAELWEERMATNLRKREERA